MLIMVKQGSARDHRKIRQKDSDHQYRLQRGIALAALKVKAEGKELRDAGGRPLHYANGAARFGFNELESRLSGRPNRSMIGDPKAIGTKRVPWDWEK